ncbi:EF-hand domain-containing protein [Luteolibacter luteus]|uniref:EF-hand domain-containing protein n=1 Tax=Luteolibacter luteus TaxID=2728835 RepID=A0A858RFQ3_9BACT|nr:hypothetical protein [Luteolibacter luteus]QJE95582.1 hypothetical protein HHL09_07205 [Luteolibacter luteus]
MTKLLLLGLVALPLAATSAHAQGTRKLDKRFLKADIDNNNALSPLEFQATQGKRVSAAYSRFRFNRADTDENGAISLNEFRASKAGTTNGKASRLDIFLTADLNDDDELSPDEYIDTLPPRVAYPKAIRSFDKRDKDDNGGLSPREFGIRRFPL